MAFTRPLLFLTQQLHRFASAHPRGIAIVWLLVALAVIFALCRYLAARTRRPIAIWGAGGYLSLLHLVALMGVLTSAHFENALAQLTLFTFPFSAELYQETGLPGFDTPHEMLANYMRYVAHFGGYNTLLLGGFLTIVPARTRRSVASLPLRERNSAQ